ncbi:type II toxin-antitoxin system PemK/MazF family toxin [Candidatus Saccharibacteria bacterium]|nr:type II toxin-antitoxin system PemK/MazF family toxin [Candidatus Saccharibacteria bacterium]
MEEKRFDQWNETKKSLHVNGKRLLFREREIWWYAAGENLGREVNGKGDHFSRPILIIRKYGKDFFFGVPLSSVLHSESIWYSEINVAGKTGNALLSQASSFSVLRLYRKISRVSKEDFIKICERLQGLLFKKFPPSYYG